VSDNQLATVEAKPSDLYKISTDVAGLCKEFVARTALKLSGKGYVKVEGWQSIAAAHGCLAEIESVEEREIEGVHGVVAWAVLKRISDQAILSRASAFVGEDEDQSGVSGKKYARYAKVQTRAISRVCRNAFAFVVVMMNAGLETTPAEEVPREGFQEARSPQSYEKQIEGVLTDVYGNPAKDKEGRETGGTIYGGKIGGIGVWTKDEALGKDLLEFADVPVDAFVVPTKKSNRLTKINPKAAPDGDKFDDKEHELDDIPF